MLPKKSFLKIFIPLLILLGSFYIGFAHPFYVGITKIAHNSQEKSLEISVRLFHDDLESALSKYAKVDIIKPKDKAEVERIIAEYMKENLRIQVNKKSVNLQFVGYQIEGDAAWCYLEVPKAGQIKTINLYNSLLVKEFKDHSNIIHVEANKVKHTTKLSAAKAQATFSF